MMARKWMHFICVPCFAINDILPIPTTKHFLWFWWDHRWSVKLSSVWPLNTFRSTKIGCHSTDIFKCIFLNENVYISINISLKFVPNGPINNIPTLVQIMAWRRSGDKPLSEPMLVSLLTHICVIRPQWVNGMYLLVGVLLTVRMHYLKFKKPISLYLRS